MNCIEICKKARGYHCIYKMGDIVVNSRVVARFNLSRVDRFEARKPQRFHTAETLRNIPYAPLKKQD